MIFVDTGAWYACFVRSDERHEPAVAWYSSNTERLVTTNVVLVELFTLLKVRGAFEVALAVGDDLWEGGLADVLYLTEADFVSAWNTYRSFHDKAWSFADCTSRVAMRRLGIKRAFAFDEHFRQFGEVTLFP